TWFYRFFLDAFRWIALLQIVALILSTCVVFIDPGEQGLLERFGKPVAGRTLLNPGGHLKFPWPIDRVYRYQTELIQSFHVGSLPEPMLEYMPAVLWTVPHTKEEVNFVVANRDRSAASNSTTARRAPPVSLLTVSIPIQYQINDLLAWAYNNNDG